jgi:hypothetical protein
MVITRSRSNFEAIHKSEEKQKAIDCVQEEIGIFIKLYVIAKEMNDIANSRRNPTIIQKIIYTYLKKLKKWERKERLHFSVAKMLSKAGSFLYALDMHVSAEDRIKMHNIIDAMSIHEKLMLKDTILKLEPELERKRALQVNILAIRQITDKLLKDILNLLAGTKEINTILIKY